MASKHKLFCKIALFVVLFLGSYRFCKKQTGGFQDYMVRSDLSYHPEWEVKICPQDTQEMKAAFATPFRYLAKGAQSFVFVSEDGKYILKLFRQDHLRFPLFLKPLKHVPFLNEIISQKIAIKEEQMQRDFLSYKIAYESLQKETGLIFVHLNKTSDLHVNATVFDKIGVLHMFDLDSMEFLVQKKATLLYEGLDELLAKADIPALKAVLQELTQLLAKRCQMGIFDKDPDLNTNFGILDGHPVQIDVGRFRTNQAEKNPEIYKKEIARIIDNLSQKLFKSDPTLSDYLIATIDEIPHHVL